MPNTKKIDEVALLNHVASLTWQIASSNGTPPEIHEGDARKLVECGWLKCVWPGSYALTEAGEARRKAYR